MFSVDKILKACAFFLCIFPALVLPPHQYTTQSPLLLVQFYSHLWCGVITRWRAISKWTHSNGSTEALKGSKWPKLILSFRSWEDFPLGLLSGHVRGDGTLGLRVSTLKKLESQYLCESLWTLTVLSPCPISKSIRWAAILRGAKKYWVLWYYINPRFLIIGPNAKKWEDSGLFCGVFKPPSAKCQW